MESYPEMDNSEEMERYGELCNADDGASKEAKQVADATRDARKEQAEKRLLQNQQKEALKSLK